MYKILIYQYYNKKHIFNYKYIAIINIIKSFNPIIHNVEWAKCETRKIVNTIFGHTVVDFCNATSVFVIFVKKIKIVRKVRLLSMRIHFVVECYYFHNYNDKCIGQ